MKKLLTFICIIGVVGLLTLQPAFAEPINPASTSTSNIKNTIVDYLSIPFTAIEHKNPGELKQMKSLVDINSIGGASAYKYETGKARYLIASNILTKSDINSFSNIVTYNNLSISGNQATADIILNENIDYSFLQEPFTNSIHHTISLRNNNGKWIIINDDYTDDFKNVFNVNTDFGLLIENLKK